MLISITWVYNINIFKCVRWTRYLYLILIRLLWWTFCPRPPPPGASLIFVINVFSVFRVNNLLPSPTPHPVFFLWTVLPPPPLFPFCFLMYSFSSKQSPASCCIWWTICPHWSYWSCMYMYIYILVRIAYSVFVESLWLAMQCAPFTFSFSFSASIPGVIIEVYIAGFVHVSIGCDAYKAFFSLSYFISLHLWTW